MGVLDMRRATETDDDVHVFAREDIIAENDEEAVVAATQLQKCYRRVAARAQVALIEDPK
jgi:hypothetical protein